MGSGKYAPAAQRRRRAKTAILEILLRRATIEEDPPCPLLPMSLRYLDFDFSEDAEGTGTFDAMASASLAQLPALQAEISAVLAWAHQHWPDACAPVEDGGAWHYDLQGVQEVSQPLVLEFDAACGQLRTQAGSPAPARTTLNLTLGGTADFCAALREAFAIE